MDTLSIVNKLNLVHVEITCPSGAVSKTGRGNHNDDVFTDGTVRYLDRKLLAPFTSARNAIARICRSMGTAFLGEWAIPDERLGEAEVQIGNVIDAFNAAKQKFDSGLDANLHDWLHAHPEIQPYESRFPKDTEIVAGISIHAAVYKIQPGNGVPMNGASDDAITHAVGGLSGQVLHEIAQEAQEAFSRNATEATSKARNVLKRIEKKLRSLMFVDAKLASVADTISSLLAFLPNKGKIVGVAYAVYAGVMNALMNPDTVILLCEGTRSAINGGDWSAFGTATVTPVVSPAPIAVDSPDGVVAAPEPTVADPPEAPVVVPPPAVDEPASPDLVTDNGHGVITVEPSTTVAPALLPPPSPAAQHSYGDWSW